MIITITNDQEWNDLAGMTVADFITNYTDAISSEIAIRKKEADAKQIVQLITDRPDDFAAVRDTINTMTSVPIALPAIKDLGGGGIIKVP